MVPSTPGNAGRSHYHGWWLQGVCREHPDFMEVAPSVGEWRVPLQTPAHFLWIFFPAKTTCWQIPILQTERCFFLNYCLLRSLGFHFLFCLPSICSVLATGCPPSEHLTLRVFLPLWQNCHKGSLLLRRYPTTLSIRWARFTFPHVLLDNFYSGSHRCCLQVCVCFAMQSSSLLTFSHFLHICLPCNKQVRAYPHICKEFTKLN